MLNRGGFTLIEVLVTLVILMFGLLGIAGLMAKGQKASFEAYQRQSALSVANDMVERIRLNPAQSTVYVAAAAPGTPIGTDARYQSGGYAPNCGAATCTAAELAAYDLALWDGLLQGYGERNAGGVLVGGIQNARGCIEELANTTVVCPAPPAAAGNFFTRTNRVSVAWQGQEDTGAPVAPPSICGAGLYGATNGMRRLISLDVMVQIQCP